MKRFQFSLRALLLSAVVVASSMGAFGDAGIGVAMAVLILIWCYNLGWLWGRWDNPHNLRAAFIVLGVLWLLLSPARSRPREWARTELCGDRMERIAAALQAYHTEHGRFPPAYVCDAEGRAMHSWRVLILPYLGRQELYDRYDFSQAWNSPKNAKLAGEIPEEYICPSDCRDRSPEVTNRVAVVGADTAWPGVKSLARDDIRDGPGNTLMVIEVAAKAGIHWMEPRDLSLEEACTCLQHASESALPHSYRETQPGSQAVFADGSVRFIRADLGPSAINGLLTASDGEPIDRGRLRLLRIRSVDRGGLHRLIALVILVLSSVLLVRGTPTGEEHTADKLSMAPDNSTTPDLS